MSNFSFIPLSVVFHCKNAFLIGITYVSIDILDKTYFIVLITMGLGASYINISGVGLTKCFWGRCFMSYIVFFCCLFICKR